ncbi:hypothetical protein GXW82_03385 [Streptacidiphilus sp. 4-A2]|nr:hypothetical protein [Streptacidiphilus sp. 4-A2]
MGDDERADQTVYAQTGLFASSGADGRTGGSRDRADAVAGHSVGEIAAAHPPGYSAWPTPAGWWPPGRD